MNEPVFNPGDLVRIVPPSVKVHDWQGLRLGMDGVVLDGPHPVRSPIPGVCTTNHTLYISGRTQRVISIALEKIDGPPLDEEDFKTEAGRWTPVNADTVEAGDEEFDPPRHVTHFATCPNANNHRKGKSKT